MTKTFFRFLLDIVPISCYNSPCSQTTAVERWLSWSKAHDWKSCRAPKALEGSNPSLSAIKKHRWLRPWVLFYFSFATLYKKSKAPARSFPGQLLPRRPVSRHRDAGHDVQGDLRQDRPASEDALALARGLRHADLRPGAVEHLRRIPRGAVQHVRRGVRPLRLPQLDEPRDCDNHDISRHRHLLAREGRRACARRQDASRGARLAGMV